MTDELPPRLTRLTFHGPLSEARAARIVARLTGNSPRTVLDIGCGWGELMLRVLAAAPDATGLGDKQEWLAAHPGHPKAAEIRAEVDQHRSYWLRGYYGLLGQAYLTLVPVG